MAKVRNKAWFSLNAALTALDSNWTIASALLTILANKHKEEEAEARDPNQQDPSQQMVVAVGSGNVMCSLVG